MNDYGVKEDKYMGSERKQSHHWNNPLAMAVLQEDGRGVVVPNRAFLALFKYEEAVTSEAIPLLSLMCSSQPDGTSAEERVDRFSKNITKAQHLALGDWRFKRQDEAVFLATVSCFDLPPEGAAESQRLIVIRDVTVTRHKVNYRALANRVNRLCIENPDSSLMLKKIIKEIRQITECDAVGIRLEHEGDFPYLEQEGFSNGFITAESSLILRSPKGDICRNPDGSPRLECTCGLILEGKTDPENPLFTKNGSAWTNDSFPLLDVPEEDDVRTNPRNTCIHEGYGSIAIIPIRDRDSIKGLLHLTAKAKHHFTLEAIEILEEIAYSIGMTLLQRQAEAELRNHDLFLRAVIESVPLPLFTKNKQGRYQVCNQFFADFLGLPLEEIEQKTVFDISPPDLAEVYHAKDLELLDADHSIQQVYECQVDAADKGRRDVVFHKACITNSENEITGLIGVISDVTDRKKAEKSLRELQQRFVLATSGTGMGIWDYFPEEDRLVWDEQMFKLFAVDPTEFEGKLADWSNRLYPSKRDETIQRFSEAIDICKTLQMDFPISLPEGGIRYLAAIASFTKNDEGKVIRITGMNYDVSDQYRTAEEKAQLEAELIHANKLEAVSQLAAGIAHEINTPIQFVGNNLTFFKDSLKDLFALIETTEEMPATAPSSEALEPLRQAFHQIAESADFSFLKEELPSALKQTIEGVNRVAEIVRAMRAFSHPDCGDKKMSNINDCIKNTVTISRNEWKYVADLNIDLDMDIPSVTCHPGAINQVLMNLIVNASQAIEEKQQQEMPGQEQPEKGLITVKTRQLDRSVIIEITDTGMGIPEEVKPRLFEPFFTTKEVGKGTGQGLPIARNIIVHDHKGKINFSSVRGKGTTFTIELPINEAGV
jgi:PAS domain S-box-containing protein